MTSRIGAWLVPGLVLMLSACAVVKEDAPSRDRSAAQTPAGDAGAASESATAEGPAAQPSPPPEAAGAGGDAQSEEETVALSRTPSEPSATATPSGETRPEPQPAAPAPAPEDPDGGDIGAESRAAFDDVPDSPFVFNVGAAPKEPSHPFYGVGSRLGFVVNGVHGKPLVLVRGKTYTFKVDTGVQHDFYFSTSEKGWGAATYTQGVNGQFTYRGAVTFTPTAETPDVLYYQCRNHKNMGGVIHVVDEGERAKTLAELEAEAREAADAQQRGAERPSVTESQVEQKIRFAEMFINQSSSAKRVQGSGNVQAMDTYRLAQRTFSDSKQALSAGRNADALALVDEAMRLMSEAARKVPKETDSGAQRARYNELLEGTQTFEESYRRNYERMVEKKGADNVQQVDLDEIHAMVRRSQRLAEDGQYAEAIGVLTQAQETLTAALSKMLDDESISYELVFETPKEEYEYELARYLSYEELIPIAIEQKRPPQQTVELMNQFVEKARSIKELSGPEAEKGNYKDAILMLQGATSHIQRALRVVGVR